MITLQERLYQYIEEERFSVLRSDGEYLLAKQLRDEAREKLCAELTREQQHLLSRYMDEESRLSGIQCRHIFRETLALIPDILHLSL